MNNKTKSQWVLKILEEINKDCYEAATPDDITFLPLERLPYVEGFYVPFIVRNQGLDWKFSGLLNQDNEIYQVTR